MHSGGVQIWELPREAVLRDTEITVEGLIFRAADWATEVRQPIVAAQLQDELLVPMP